MCNEKYFVAHKKYSDTFSAWYCCLISKGGKCAKCKTCSVVLKTLGGSTKGLHAHLSAKHVSKVQKEFKVTAFPSISQACVKDTFLSKKRKINDYFSTNEE